MKKRILALCDEEQEYACHFMDYLGRPEIREGFPYEVHIFTEPDAIDRFCEQKEASFLLITQSLYEKRADWRAEGLLVLTEEGAGPEGVPWTEKYQPMETLLRKILELSAQAGLLPPAAFPDRPGSLRLIGVYSPIRRCLQTTFSFTLGQLLARRQKTLYLNFECFSGLSRLLRREFQTDLSDLIYFLRNRDERFPYRLEGMVQKLNGLDYIPPAYSCMDLMRVEKAEWLSLLDELEKYGLYRYVILDLSESIQGLFDILQRCTKVYTMVRQDGIAQAKQEQYEEWLQEQALESILSRTRKCGLPLFHSLPVGLENFTRGELAETVARLIEEDLPE